MALASVTRQDDCAYAVWMSSQQDVWYETDEEEEEATQLALFDEMDDLAIELNATEGLPFTDALHVAEGMLPGLAAFAQDWDRHAWLGGNEAAKLF